MERESFIFYRSFPEGIENLSTPEEKWEAVKAILYYGLKDIDKSPEGYARILYDKAKLKIDAIRRAHQ